MCKAEKIFLDKIKRNELKVFRNGTVLNTLTGNYFTGLNSSGYPQSCFKISGKTYSITNHKLIWLYFNGNIPEGKQINHIDGNKKNNNIENLEIVTAKQNTRHAYKNGLAKGLKGKRNPAVKINENRVNIYRKRYHCGLLKARSISQIENVSMPTVYDMLNGKTFKHIDGPYKNIMSRKDSIEFIIKNSFEVANNKTGCSKSFYNKINNR